MNTLTNKRFEQYTYLCRYANFPYYYDTLCDRDVYGIGAQINKNTVYQLHEVIATDTLDYLALKYYGNPTYWWIIAYFNDIQDSFIKLSLKYKTLKIPAFTSVSFNRT